MYTLPAVHTTRINIEGGINPDPDDVIALVGVARGNRANVIEGAQSVERELEEVIAGYFFPSGGEKSEEFRSLIVESDTCSFAAKRRLAMWIFEKKSLLQGAKKAEHDKLLADTMRFRNAFAHGSLSSNGKIVTLSYFEGGPKAVELTDEYLRKVETTLSRAFHETHGLREAGHALDTPKG